MKTILAITIALILATPARAETLVSVAARNDVRPDAQSRALSDAH